MPKLFKALRTEHFDYGHRVPNHTGKCSSWHGHRGKIEVTITGPLIADPEASSNGMVIDFGDIKTIVNEEICSRFDHGFIWQKDDPVFKLQTFNILTTEDVVVDEGLSITIQTLEVVGKTILIPFAPTAENLAYLSFGLLQKRFRQMGGLWVSQVKFWETESCAAVFPV